ncbi:MAG: SOS response-associated peptidase [Bacteroidia bacterium]|nr:SOS response-associated peptidase [Bacteroidia bacterium]
MCYTTEALTVSTIKYARHRGDYHLAEELERKLNELLTNREPKYYVSGFTHPSLLIFTNQQPYTPQLFTWGLIPSWTKTLADGKKFWNNTLNARGETIFEKPSFKDSAKNKRCLIYIDAFYEHHHYNKQTYPFRIALKSGEPMSLAGLWQEWTDRSTGEILQTFSIVTTVGNPIMTKIHNNPKAEGPRMPVILTKETQDEWLIDCKTEQDKEHLQSLIKPLDENLLTTYTVGRISGKNSMANTKEAENEVIYNELPALH